MAVDNLESSLLTNVSVEETEYLNSAERAILTNATIVRGKRPEGEKPISKEVHFDYDFAYN